MTRMVAVKTYLLQDAKPFTTSEFAAFWKSCSDQERSDYARDAAQAIGATLDPVPGQ